MADFGCLMFYSPSHCLQLPQPIAPSAYHSLCLSLSLPIAPSAYRSLRLSLSLPIDPAAYCPRSHCLLLLISMATTAYCSFSLPIAPAAYFFLCLWLPLPIAPATYRSCCLSILHDAAYCCHNISLPQPIALQLIAPTACCSLCLSLPIPSSGPAVYQSHFHCLSLLLYIAPTVYDSRSVPIAPCCLVLLLLIAPTAYWSLCQLLPLPITLSLLMAPSAYRSCSL